VLIYTFSVNLYQDKSRLPVKIVKLIIPANEEPAGITYSFYGEKIISLDYPIIPIQKPIPTTIEFEGNDFVKPNWDVYSNDKSYPQNIARIIRTNYIRGNKIVIIEVNPLVYNPVKNQVETYESLDINLQLKPTEKRLKSSPVKNKMKYNQYLKVLVDNKSDVEKYSVIKEKKKLKEDNDINLKSISIYCEYVVITTSALSSYFDDFIAWKKQKGIDIELVTVESIYQNYSGDLISGIYDNAGRIRQFLSDAYDNGLEYALLGGDSSKVPIRYGWGNNYTTNPEWEIPSDLYYSDFDGDWNDDYVPDNRYGEPGDDDVEYGPEIFVGRLLCTSSSHVQAWTQKLITYEQNPGNGSTSYLRKAFYTQSDEMQDDDQATDIAGRFGNIFTTNEIFEEIYEDTPDFDSDESPQFPLGSDVIDEMNSGYGFISWFNHGKPSTIAVATKGKNDCGGNDKKKVTNYDNNLTYCEYPENDNGLDDLSNNNQPYILYSIACSVTPFDTWLSTSPTSNLGALNTIQPTHGGVAFLGNTRLGFVGSSWDIYKEFADNISGGIYQLGAAEGFSKVPFLGYLKHYTRLSHNLIGCPETEMWTDTPSEFLNAHVVYYEGVVTVYTGGVANTTCVVLKYVYTKKSRYV